MGIPESLLALHWGGFQAARHARIPEQSGGIHPRPQQPCGGRRRDLPGDEQSAIARKLHRIPHHQRLHHRPTGQDGADLAAVRTIERLPPYGGRRCRPSHGTEPERGPEHSDATCGWPSAVRGCGVPLQRRARSDSERRQSGGPHRLLCGPGWRIRKRQKHAVKTVAALLPPQHRPRSGGWTGYQQGGAVFAAAADRRGAPRHRSVRWHDPRQPADGETGCQRCGVDGCSTHCLCSRFHHESAQGVQLRCGRARSRTLRRPAAAVGPGQGCAAKSQAADSG